jgi:hypothetical protein
MATRTRVVIDLDLPTGAAALKLKELAFQLAQAVETYQIEHGDDVAPVTVTSLRVPDEHQTFAQARELYDVDAFRRWQQRKRTG